ncbi:MAG: ABC transporter substrate-binding protein [Chloroflexi bacterium]|nr:ABC transporter substrate-binding protein [Chloroflexota bacterium]
MGKASRHGLLGLILIGGTLVLSLMLTACAAPAPTATPTSPSTAAATPTKAAPTPTKAPTATPTKRPVTKVEVVQSSLTSITYAPAFIAKEKGYFLEEGLDVSWITAGSGAKALAAVIGRSAQIGQAAGPDLVNAVAQGQPAKVFAQLGKGVPGWVIVSKTIADQRGITPKMTLEEKGKAVKGLTFTATSPGSGTDFQLRYFLRKAGLDPDRDVNITYVGSDAMLAALEQGAVDGVSHTAPEQTLAPVQAGKAVMVADLAAGEVPGTADIFWMMSLSHRDELERQPQLFEAYARGLWRADKLIAEQDVEARDLLKKTYFPDMDAGLYKLAWDLTRPTWPKEPTLTPEQLKATVDFRNATSPPPPVDIKFDDFGTNKFGEAAKKQLGF